MMAFLKKMLLNTGFLIKVSWSPVFCTLLTTACNNNLMAKHSLFSKGKRECDSYQIQKEYLVLWKNGKITVEKYENDDSFVKNFVKNHEDEIVSSEPHYQIDLGEDPKFYNINEDPLLNWGQEVVLTHNQKDKNLK